MALHVRSQLRRQARALLASLPALGGNVFIGRTWPVGPEILPCGLVYTADEPSLDMATSPVRQQRLLSLHVEARARARADEALLDGLDEIALQVEQALLAAGAFGALAKSVELGQTLVNATAASDSRYGELQLAFRIEYHTGAGTPDVAL